MTEPSSNRRAQSRAVRERMAATGENYTTARRAVTGETSTAVIDPVFLAPYPDELVRPEDAGDTWRPVTVAELGVRALPADATPEQRARAESIWRAVTADRPCRCSGRCIHGAPCNNGDDGIGSCRGSLVHVDRQAASRLDVIGWYDSYVCDDCGEEYDLEVDLPEVPWGEETERGFREFEGVRRVQPVYYLPDEEEDDDPWEDHGECPDCGGQYNRYGYGCTCP